MTGKKIIQCTDEKTQGLVSLLSNREREVLTLIAQGHTNRKVAGLLKLSVKTVESHRARLMVKLELTSRAELVRFALQCGVLALEKFNTSSGGDCFQDSALSYGSRSMKVSITTQSTGRDDAQTMVIDISVHPLYRGCRTLEDVRTRCQEVLDSVSVFAGPLVRIVDIKEIKQDD